MVGSLSWLVLYPKVSETAILDFNVPRGLHLSISKSPNPLFSTSYSMNAVPSLNGSVGYIFTSCDLDIKNSGDVRFKDMIERFKLYSQPRRPEGKEEWLAGQRVDSRGMCPSATLPTCHFETLTDRALRQIISSMVAYTCLLVDWMHCTRPGSPLLFKLW